MICTESFLRNRLRWQNFHGYNFIVRKIFNTMSIPNSLDWTLKWWYGMLLNVAKQLYNLQIMWRPLLLTLTMFTVRVLGCILFPKLYGPKTNLMELSELREWDRKYLSFWNCATETVAPRCLKILLGNVIQFIFLQIYYISKIRNEIPW
jgi:hypothetical protein